MLQNVFSDYIDFKNTHVQELDISPTQCAFNTGVYVTDLDVWRKHNITAQLERWLVLNTQYVPDPALLVVHRAYL